MRNSIKKREKRSAKVFIRVRPSLKKFAERQAKKKNLTVAEWIDELLEVSKNVQTDSSLSK